ncbi:integrating conjugative element protein [Enterobacter hormaechei]|uniref:integrating conjugative element protein n=1 Tax=Enterobacter hormaechei TaxID=158836 RepID=UPI000FBEC9F2|nr:integrating conjugative element protein [Enterobacter hormaechei]EBY2574009.1 integrating conjugative element protein [Salmonella enterica subsp. enterica serovar Newport]EEO0342474.1 integrating conjugative element protein [Salmonella enterica]ECE7417329.1 integrating conjugative element protein [Salmonella enterica subsp. enterica serovar Newport]EKD5911807.1 integrating conjugative element protein [Salmonella enterica subsp. enterica serovar Newport]EKD5922204.1 integrating conjugative e
MKYLIPAMLLIAVTAVAGPAVPIQALDESRLLPVVTHNLHPGQQPRLALNLPGMTPLFLIGDDPLSTEWLRQHREALKNLHATGLVVNVTTLARLIALRATAPELTLLPVSADDMAKHLPITAYPVLITDKGLEQ